MTNTLFLLSTSGCHLCEVAQRELDNMRLKYEIIDIIDDEQLVANYGDKIPVLIVEKAEQALFWPFESQQIKQYIDHYGISST